MTLGAQGAGTGNWDPQIFSGLVGDWDATKETFNDGDAVGTFTDRSPGVSGTPRNLTQATTAAKPTFKTGANGINGRSVLSFNGSNEMFGASTFTTFSTATVISVVQTGTDVTGNHTIWADGSDSTPNLLVASSVAIYAAPTTLTGSAVATSTNYIITATLNGASSVLRVNGSQTSITTGASTYGGWLIGSAGGSQTWNGLIGRVCVYNRALSPVEIAMAEIYLHRIWGF